MRAKLLRNIAGNWLGLGADAVTGFVLTRFILHSIGDASFGLWALLSGFLGYYGLLDLGTRNAVIRYVARHNATGDYESVSSVLATALSVYLCAGVLVLLVALVGAWHLDSMFLFRSHQELADGRKLVLILGVGAAVGFPLSAFGGALEGLQQFVRIGIVQAAASVGRAIAVVVFLGLGYGVVALGVITVVANVVAGLVNARFVLTRYPELGFGRRYVRVETLRILASFGVVTFWIGIANRLRFDSDAFVIGKILGLEAIALFAIATRIIAYSSEAVAAMSGVFTPLLSHADALGDKTLVRKATLQSNFYASLLAFPCATLLVFFGRLLIELWVGPGYGESYRVILVLAVPMALYVSQGGTSRMMYAIGTHRQLSNILICEGVGNVVLSILFAQRFGLIGVAWGTAIPLSITSLVILPWYACRSLEMSVARYWAAAQLRALLICVPVIVLWGLFYWGVPTPSIAASLSAVAGGGLVYLMLTYRQFSQSRTARA